VITPALAAPIVLALCAGASLALWTGGAGEADERVRDRNDRGQVAGGKPVATGLAAGVVVQPNRCMPRARVHLVPISARLVGACNQRPVSSTDLEPPPGGGHAPRCAVEEAEPSAGKWDDLLPALHVAVRLSPSWHGYSAAGAPADAKAIARLVPRHHNRRDRDVANAITPLARLHEQKR
jgi:hypothetical protein